ncbi:uncharacterized protein ColSpa_10824 [Colletotrichum spaethianum]|uniref:Uncharacterized protein n=1 Tax=Colletotrichum spaethianum TaxID=700344 RepID=A0AA37USV7_9PEZI|nr:uncharacterized protein ColSpa_10824 [Colletotrichum spaethianum]GKT50643.1 hypothetical protein ColSpa_10824 [Colletotrichum spaethianum]
MKSTIFMAVASGIVFGAGAVNNDIIRVGDINTNEPILELTTILDGPGAFIPTSVGGNGVTVIQSTMCRPITTETCEVLEVTSTIPVSESATSAVTSEVITTSFTELVTSETSKVTTSTDIQVTQSTQSTGTIQTPSATAAAHKKESDVSGVLAGVALLMLL